MKTPLDKRVALIFDCDLTLTEEYMQMPLIRHYFENIKERYHGIVAANGKTLNLQNPEDYFKEVVDSWGINHNGISYVSQILHDIRTGVFPEITLDDFRRFGSQVELSPGLPEFFTHLKTQWKDKCDLSLYIISVGFKEMIEGTPLTKHIDKTYATQVVSLQHQYGLSEKPILDSMATAMTPFAKSQAVIQIAKGGREFVDKLTDLNDYYFDYRNIITLGDGLSDVSQFAYLRDKGSKIVCVYKKGDKEAYDKIDNNKIVRERVHALLQRDYRVGSKLWLYINSTIHHMLKRECNFDPEVLARHQKSKIRDPNIDKVVGEHLMHCTDCDGLYGFHWERPTTY